ncbi:MAG: hypothetical protein ABSE86_39225, partial [Bryobacteraceae bacterium]
AADPLFNAVGAGVAQVDTPTAIASAMGRLGGDPQSLASAYASEFALIRSVLLGYPLSQTPPPATPPNVTDVTAIPFAVTAGSQGSLISLGGLSTVGVAIDPFVMEEADGLQVGWGQLIDDGVSQMERIYNLILDLEFRTPYLARVQSSNVASHIVRSMVQSATGNAISGTLGTPSTRLAAAGIPAEFLQSGRRHGVRTPTVAKYRRVYRPRLLRRADYGPAAQFHPTDVGCTTGQRPDVHPRL